jgi:hypothetical protein
VGDVVEGEVAEQFFSLRWVTGAGKVILAGIDEEPADTDDN